MTVHTTKQCIHQDALPGVLYGLEGSFLTKMAMQMQMLNDFFFHDTNGSNSDNMWFQEDGVMSPTKFPGRVSYKRSDIDWPLRPSDLTPLTFLWGYLKGRIYVKKSVRIIMPYGRLRGGHFQNGWNKIQRPV